MIEKHERLYLRQREPAVVGVIGERQLHRRIDQHQHVCVALAEKSRPFFVMARLVDTGG